MMRMMFSLLVVTSMVSAQAMVRKMTIAAIFDEGGDRKHELAFRHAVQSINRNRWENYHSLIGSMSVHVQ